MWVSHEPVVVIAQGERGIAWREDPAVWSWSAPWVGREARGECMPHARPLWRPALHPAGRLASSHACCSSAQHPGLGLAGPRSRACHPLPTHNTMAGVFSAQEAVDLAAAQLAAGAGPKAACNRLLHEAVRVRACRDNCTVMLLVLARDRPAVR